MSASPSGALYRTLWRWHFYAGLFCIPFVIILSITGSVYLFRVEIESLLNRDVLHLANLGHRQCYDSIVQAALGSHPGATLANLTLPHTLNEAVRVLISVGDERHVVWVRPDTLEIVKSVPREDTFQIIVSRLHGELLAGNAGSLIVELAASWAIVMVLTGLYLWWPRQARGLGGVLYPRWSGRHFWRDLHAVIGIYISVFALFLLITGLPWALVWGEAFKQARIATGTAPITQTWSISSSDEHAEHTHSAHAQHIQADALPITVIVEEAAALGLTAPVVLAPPTKRQPYWQARSETPNRPLGGSAYLSPQTGEVVFRQDFTDRHIIDRVVGVGIAAHEGRLFGAANQILGLLTAIGLVTLCVSAVVMWRKRAPTGVLGAPPPIPDAKIGWGLAVLIVIAAILLPVLGGCLLLIALVERSILARWPAARQWLGLKLGNTASASKRANVSPQ
jgi:uncharacterized iron-regulated membrane protein